MRRGKEGPPCEAVGCLLFPMAFHAPLLGRRSEAVNQKRRGGPNGLQRWTRQGMPTAAPHEWEGSRRCSRWQRGQGCRCPVPPPRCPGARAAGMRGPGWGRRRMAVVGPARLVAVPPMAPLAAAHHHHPLLQGWRGGMPPLPHTDAPHRPPRPSPYPPILPWHSCPSWRHHHPHPPPPPLFWKLRHRLPRFLLLPLRVRCGHSTRPFFPSSRLPFPRRRTGGGRRLVGAREVPCRPSIVVLRVPCAHTVPPCPTVVLPVETGVMKVVVFPTIQRPPSFIRGRRSLVGRVQRRPGCLLLHSFPSHSHRRRCRRPWRHRCFRRLCGGRRISPLRQCPPHMGGGCLAHAACQAHCHPLRRWSAAMVGRGKTRVGGGGRMRRQMHRGHRSRQRFRCAMRLGTQGVRHPFRVTGSRRGKRGGKHSGWDARSVLHRNIALVTRIPLLARVIRSIRGVTTTATRRTPL